MGIVCERGRKIDDLHELNSRGKCKKYCLVEDNLEYINEVRGFLGGASDKEPTCQCGRQGMLVCSLSWEGPLEEGMEEEERNAIHSNFLAWRIPWTEEPGGLPSMGSQRVGHD